MVYMSKNCWDVALKYPYFMDALWLSDSTGDLTWK